MKSLDEIFYDALRCSSTLVSDWRPIETAPKDGTVVDLWAVENGVGERWTDCRWAEQFNAYAGQRANRKYIWAWWHSDYTVDGNITHWMPLPDAPQAERI